jgi:hypothetical protein
MRNRSDGSIRLSGVISPEFLHRLAGRDDPSFAHEATVAGLGTVWPLDDGSFALYLPGQSFDRGHRPVGIFRERWRRCSPPPCSPAPAAIRSTSWSRSPAAPASR